MKRRNFINALFSASLGISLTRCKPGKTDGTPEFKMLHAGSFSLDDNRVSCFLDEAKEPLKIIQITDTHLWMDDIRGESFTRYSQRMAKAYNTTKHFKTGEMTNPVISFEETLEMAVKENADLFAMTGDIFSFPSEAAIEWVYGKLSDAGIPYLFISGNHDWHYEGMEGSSQTLRDTWTSKRLTMLYNGNDPLMASYKIKWLNVLAIDNSTYEILPGQLEFFREHVRRGDPFILMMHIPVYVPGRSFGCGNPDWGAETDKGYEIERRERWPEEGHSQVTMDFAREVFLAPNLLGIFAGHIHRQSLDLYRGVPQLVADANATGAFLEIDFLPL